MRTIRTVKGMTYMNNIHPDYKTKKILGYIADLIIEYGYDNYADLSESDLHGLVVLLNEAGGTIDELSFISEGNSGIMSLFRKSLVGNIQDNENFLDALKTSAIQYYEHTMESLFNYVHRDYQQSRREWLDHAAKYGDPDAAYDQYRETL
jgi:hypothetical protein